MIVTKILYRNLDLPFSNYYLDLSDFLIDEAYVLLCQKVHPREITRKIEEIELFIQTAIDLFLKEHNFSKKNDIVVRGFFSKKTKLKNGFVALQSYAKKRIAKCSVL